jgi:WD40 repeat protein
VVHRDLKPGNVLLSGADRVAKITDFGLAKRLDAEARDLSQSGAILGTASYMAPEQAAGKVRDTGPATDVYALGAILYEMLTGRPPFRETTPLDTILKVIAEEPPHLSQVQPKVPRDLAVICHKCLRKDSRQRYVSAEALADDLRRFMDGEPISARPVSAAELAWRRCRRNPAVATLSAAVLLLLTVSAVVGVALSVSRGKALEEARDAGRLAKEQLLASYVSEARARRFSGRAGQRFGTLEAVRKAAALARELEMPASTFAELRDLAVSALSLPDLRLEAELEGWPEDCEYAGFDKELEHGVRSDAKGNVTVFRVADNRELARLPGKGEARLVGWEHQASSVTFWDPADRALFLWNYQTKELTRLFSTADLRNCDCRRTPDGWRMAAIHHDGTIDVIDYPSGLCVRRFRVGHWPRPRPAATSGSVYVSLHPFRSLLALSLLREPGGVVHVVDLDRGEVIAKLQRPGEDEAGQMGWLPDGRTLAVGYNASVVLWDVPSRRPVHVHQHRGRGLCAQANALGDVVTWSEWAGGTKLWDGQTGKLLLSVPGVYLRFESRGHRFLGQSRSGTPRQLWLLHSARECRTLVRAPFRGDPGVYWRTAIHRGGQLAAAGTTAGVTLLDLATGIDVGHLDLGHNWNVTFDPATGDLLTYGELGLFRWPVQVTGDDPRRVRLGPPRRLPLAGRGVSAAIRMSDDGKTLAVAQGDQAVVLHEDRLDRPIVLRPLEDVRSHLAISPDGRWVATGRNDGHGGDIRVWDARTGALVKAFGIREGMCVGFSPDGRWLVANDKSRYRFWHVGTWEEGPQEPVKTPMFVDWPPAFSPVGGVMALERGDGAVRLIDVGSGRDLAVLEDPRQGRAGEMAFSPDGTRLLLVNKDENVLRLWDLRLLREGLKALDLDWAAPAFRAEDRGGALDAPRRPLEVEVIGAEKLPGPEKRTTAWPRRGGR